MSQPHQSMRLADYRPPAYTITDVDLTFELEDHQTRVTAVSQVVRQGETQAVLELDGEHLTLLALTVDGEDKTPEQQTDTALVLTDLPEQFELKVVTEIDPANNTALEGLYKSDGTFCTQCEAQGFRRITYFLDRPDVMAKYSVKVIADKHKYPSLLSNGNLVERGDLDDGRHWVRWQDPFAKPCYLFALVAGDFDCLTDRYTTGSGREVALELYVDKGNRHRGYHALASLKKAMQWDEQVYGLEYDLGVYMVVAVDFFNMGAMENKGLNIFNAKFVLADAESATDDDYFNIESVIAHEYFHNWTGNRVTCRDWFQLSLKEGLTVFRDQQFSADMASPALVRIKQARVIREHQFAEDAGPMAHPIRPEEVMEMNNFYSVTVYDKGAEVIRMLQRLLGQGGFRKGMDLYFERHDGQAVTCDDFVQAMADANGVDLEQFKRWYSQSGTPQVTVQSEYDAKHQQLILTLSQHTPPTQDQADKQPLPIPFGVELVDEHGSRSEVLSLSESEQRFCFDHVASNPAIACLTGFSAPVKVKQTIADSDLIRIALKGQDDFVRWDACQTLFSQHIHQLAEDSSRNSSEQVSEALSELIAELLKSPPEDAALLAEMLMLPSFDTLSQQQDIVNVDGLLRARKLIVTRLAQEFATQWQQLVDERPKQDYAYTAEQANWRRLLDRAMFYLAHSELPEAETQLQQVYQDSDNMTQTLGVLTGCQQANLSLFDSLMSDFEQLWRKDSLVMDKWFSLHASRPQDDMAGQLESLMEHPMYSINNPNKVRAIWGPFAMRNPQAFHQADGRGYRLLTDYLLNLDSVNPQVASRLVTPLLAFKRFDLGRQQHMRQQLERLAEQATLSRDLYEKVTRALKG
ncbi:Membrane alanyl aminopeptidase [Saliniradius amylolyticus]|uniref:Aminopeptidase N n=1 Tax=Saliniradius amylolyticus TaxID=2183582 RepID=A0A2S2E3Q6_9ALTE|nr:aminopeptidase N [Saliniradius amylolyticus]AWL11890.1 Membrane alanyl aminopeptidase [Saliniradius amylolyticus]